MPGYTWDSYYATCFSKTLEAIMEPFRRPACSVSTGALSCDTWHRTRAHHLRYVIHRWKTRELTWIIFTCEILQSYGSKLYQIFLSFFNGLFLLSMPIATILVQASFTCYLVNCMRNLGICAQGIPVSTTQTTSSNQWFLFRREL